MTRQMGAKNSNFWSRLIPFHSSLSRGWAMLLPMPRASRPARRGGGRGGGGGGFRTGKERAAVPQLPGQARGALNNHPTLPQT